MPTFELSTPDGATYHVDAPDEHAAVAALGQVTTAPRQQAAPSAAAGPKSTLQTIREALHAPTRALENGVFLGLGDRARAVVDSAVEGIGGNGWNYSANLKKEQGDTEQFAKDHPIASPVLEASGGVIAPVGVLSAASKGAGLGGRMLYGGAAGAGIGATQGAASSKDWTNPTQVAKDAAFGGGTGLVLGGALPAVGAGAGAVYNAAANLARGRVDGMSRGVSSHLVKAVEADGPAAVQARLQELGPDAMLVDAGPALLGKGQGASLNSDEGRSVLQSALTARNEGTNARVQSDVNRALGPAEDPQTVTDAIRAHRSAVDNVNYPAALDSAPPVRIAPVMTDLIDRIHQAPVGSMEHRALTNLQEMLTREEQRPRLDAFGRQQINPQTGQPIFDRVPVSHDDAGILHKVKGELDNVIEYDAPGLGVPAGALTRQQGSLRQMRGAINDVLEQQVPGYANANAVSAALARRGEAVNLGTQYRGSGKTTASPDRFAAAFDPLSQGEKIAFAKGSRGEIDRVLGTKANDLQALRAELQGEGGWDTAKIATVHGQPAADELVSSVNRNLKFRDTHNKVVENSQTAQRTAAAKEMKPDPSSETPFINPNMSVTGLLATGAKKAAGAALNAVRPDPTRSYGEVARALTEQGAARDARLLSIIDAVQARKRNSAAAGSVGNAASIVAAIAANAAANSRKRNQQ